MSQTLIELRGSQGAGKTTLTMFLGEELKAPSILWLDASSDQDLSRELTMNGCVRSLGQIFQPAFNAPVSKVSIDWVFHDLTLKVGDDAELLSVGDLPTQADPLHYEALSYGLNRLFQEYSLILIDGYHPLIHALLPKEELRLLNIVTPLDFPTWHPPEMFKYSHTPALILNRYQGETLPVALETALTQQQIHLVGKLPRYDCSTSGLSRESLRQLSEDFRNCLLRLDVPQ